MRCMDWIDDELDAIEHLGSLSGDEYVAEAERLGFVVTERGLYLNPDHPGLNARSVDECVDLIRQQLARHGIRWSPDPDPQTTQ